MEVCWLIIDIQDTLLLDTLKQQKCSHSAGYVSTAAKYYLLKGPTQHCTGVWNTGPCPLLFSACLCVHLTETGSKPTAMVHLLRGQRRAMATKKALPVSQVKFFWPCNYHWCVESNPHFTMSSWGLKEWRKVVIRTRIFRFQSCNAMLSNHFSNLFSSWKLCMNPGADQNCISRETNFEINISLAFTTQQQGFRPVLSILTCWCGLHTSFGWRLQFQVHIPLLTSLLIRYLVTHLVHFLLLFQNMRDLSVFLLLR